jgi:hypothetical protein
MVYLSCSSFIYIYLLVALIVGSEFSTCSAGVVPELYLGVSSSTDGLATASLEPSLKWATKGSLFDDFCDYSGGINVRSEDNGELPFNVWGVIQKSIAGWKVKAKIDTKSSNLDDMDFDVQGNGGPTNLSLRVSGFLNNYRSKAISGKVQNVGFTQGFDLPLIGGEVSVSPTYNLVSKRTKLSVKYDSLSSTQIVFDANKDHQKVAVAYRVNDANTIIPSITSNGDISLEYRHAVRDAGLLTANYCPNDATTVQYEDGPWIASAVIPIDGYYKLYAKPKFMIRRSLTAE